MTTQADRFVADYLDRLRAELSDLPRARRAELVEELAEHIAEARAETAGDEAAVRTILDRLGEPSEIAREERARLGLRPARPGWKEVSTLVLLPIGGVVLPVVGWVLGVILLWISSAWTTRDKVLGTAIVPGGLLLPLFLALVPGYSEVCSSSGGFDPVTGEVTTGPVVCTGGPSELVEILWLVLFVALVVGPLAMVVYLGRRMRRPAEPA